MARITIPTLVVLLCLLFGCGSGQRNGPDPNNPSSVEGNQSQEQPRPDPWEDEEAFQNIITEMSACPEVNLGLEHPERYVDPQLNLRGWLESSFLLVEERHFGNGVDAPHSSVFHGVRLDDCSHGQGRLSYFDGALFATVVLPDGFSADRFEPVIGRVGSVEEPRFGAPHLIINHGGCELMDVSEFEHTEPWGVLPATANPQPWLQGQPQRPPDSFWSAEGLNRSATPEEASGFMVFRVGEPTPGRQVEGGRLFTSELPGRNGGMAIAFHETEGNRHRWIALTRGCVNGTTVEWFAEGQGLLLGMTASQHSVYAEMDGLLLLDFHSGKAFRIMINREFWQPAPSDIDDEEMSPEMRSGVRFAPDGFILRTPQGEQLRVTMADVRARISNL